MPSALPCLTVIQPWATLIALGAKRVETRDWLRRDLIGRRIAIHAATRWTPPQSSFAMDTPIVRAILDRAGYAPAREARAAGMLPLGAVLATVRIAGFAEYAALDPQAWHRVAAASLGDFDHGRFAWLLEDVVPLERPVPATGGRGLWEWHPAA